MADEAVIKPGDKVRLKSGGPAMTASYREKTGEVPCAWFHGSDLHTAFFDDVELEPAYVVA